MGVDVGAISGKISLKDDYSKELDKFNKSIVDTGKKMQSVGKKLSIGLTAPIVATTAIVTKMGAAFDAEMVKINTLVGVSIDKVDAWNSEILKMSTAVGRGPKELAEAMFVVTSAGERGENALKILEASAQAAAVGLGDTTTVARTVTAVMQAYASTGMTASRATDVLTATVREGNLEAASLAGSLGRILGTASQVGITFEEVGSFIATFTRLGVKSEEAVTALRGTVNMLLKPTEQSHAALESVGMSFEGLRKQVVEKGLTRALVELVGKFKGNETALARVIPNVRALAGVLGTAGAQAENFIEISDSINNSQGMAAKAFETTQKSITQQFRVISATFKRALTEIGLALVPIIQDKIIPALQAAVNWLSEMAAKFRELSDFAKVTTLAIAGFAAALGPAIFAAGTFLTLLPHITAGLALVKGAFISTSAAAATAAAATVTTAVPNLATLGATMTTVTKAAIPVTASVNTLGATAVTAGTSIGKAAIGVTAVKVAVAGLIGLKIGDWFDEMAQGARGGADTVDKAIDKVGLFRAAMAAIPDLIRGYGNIVVNVWAEIGTAVSASLNMLKTNIANFFESIIDAAGPVGTLISTPIVKAVEHIQSSYQWAAEKILGANVKIAKSSTTWSDAERKVFDEFIEKQAAMTEARENFADAHVQTYEESKKAAEEASKAAAAAAAEAAEAQERLNETIKQWKIEAAGAGALYQRELQESADELKRNRLAMADAITFSMMVEHPESIDVPFMPGFGDVTEAVDKMNAAIVPAVTGFGDIQDAVQKSEEAQTRFNSQMQLSADLANAIGGTFGSIIGSITSAGSALKSLSIAGGGGLSGIVGGISSTFSKGMADAGGFGIMGMIGGLTSAIPMIGPAIGPAIQGVTALIDKFFGGTDIGEDVARDIGIGISQGLEDQIAESGKHTQLFVAQIFEEGFATGEATADLLAQEIGDIFSGIQEGVFSKGEGTAAIEQAIPLLIDHFKELGVAGEEQVNRIINAAREMGIEFQGLGDLIAATIGPVVDDVAETLGLTNQEARELAETLGVKLASQAQALGAALGIPASAVKELGTALNEQFGLGMEDIQAVMDSMGISVEQLAESLNVELPAAVASSETNELEEGTEQVGENIDGAVLAANRLAEALGRAADASRGINIPSGSNIPGLAEGGIAMQPTVALIGERGPEVVAPVDALFGQLGTMIAEQVGGIVGGNTITVAPQLTIAEPLSTAEAIQEIVLPPLITAIQEDMRSIVGEITRKQERS